MKKRNKKVKIFKILFVILLIFLVAFLIYYSFFKNNDKEEVKVVKKIDSYGYNLNDNETELYNKYFEELDKILSNADVNYEEYAKTISKLFIIDFYTLNNKLSKNDIGGTDFIKESMRDNFIEQARSTFYKYLQVKDKNRNQSLPEVSKINNVEVENTVFTIIDKNVSTTTIKSKTRTTKQKGVDVPAYKVTISWDYKEDLGYQTDAVLTIIKEDKKLYIVQMENETDTNKTSTSNTKLKSSY